MPTDAVRRFVVPPHQEAMRLDMLIARELGVSRTQAQQEIKAGRIRVGAEIGKSSLAVEPGALIEVAPPPAPTPKQAPPPALVIVFEDADMMVIDKPAGLVVHGGNGRSQEATVADAARLITSDPDLERPGIVHRLDRETSGLLVLAKTGAAKAALQAQWQSHQVRKTYQLLAVGRVEPDEAVIDLALGRDPAHPTRRRVLVGGRPAVTRYRVLAAYPGFTLAEAYPETGRTHQLRVHFAALGHPIAGDTVYGSPVRPLSLTRHFLHASVLSITTPSGQPLILTSPLPPELLAVLSRLDSAYT